MNEVVNELLANPDNGVAPIRMAGKARDRLHSVAKLGCMLSAAILAGCAGKPVIHTQIIEKPVSVYCKVQMPEECKDAYAVDRVSSVDDPIVINRAMRVELEERWACEIKLRAALKGCNK